MTNEAVASLSNTHLIPYIQVATVLIGKSREGGGNMFRHQLDTMSILLDYGYTDSVLLKASIIHDVLEDVPDFNHNNILSIDYESHAVYDLVQQVSRRREETKAEFLTRIKESGSFNAKVLKAADRISNMISLGFVNNFEFINRYIEETEKHIFPIAEEVNRYMLLELEDLVKSKRKFLLELKDLRFNTKSVDPIDFI